MNKRTYTYDPELVNMAVDGIFITGYSENEKIKAEKNEDNISVKVGVDGLVHYSKNADKTGTVTIVLASTSPSIPYLDTLAREQEEFHLSIVDMNDNSRDVNCEECRILKDKDYSVEKEVGDVEYRIFVPYMY